MFSEKSHLFLANWLLLWSMIPLRVAESLSWAYLKAQRFIIGSSSKFRFLYPRFWILITKNGFLRSRLSMVRYHPGTRDLQVKSSSGWSCYDDRKLYLYVLVGGKLSSSQKFKKIEFQAWKKARVFDWFWPLWGFLSKINPWSNMTTKYNRKNDDKRGNWKI